MIALVALLLLPQQPAPHGPEAGARRAVAGLAGFLTVSRIDFGGQENRLTAAYVFPDRTRWHFENYRAVVRSEHQYFYRAGERVRALEGGPSRELEAADRDVLVLQMELRRAVMLWPDGFEWQGTAAGERSAPVFADSCCREGRLGTLVATLDAGGEGSRPRRVEVRDREERAIEALEIRAWQEQAGRVWPHVLALQAESGGFVETVEAIDTRVHFLELSFLPPDLRPVPRPASAGPSVLARDLVSMTYSARALPDGTSWERAKELAGEWTARAAVAAKPLGLTLDPVPTFEVASDGGPRRCLLRLIAPVVPAPDGYETQPERAGLFLLLQDLKGLDASSLARLAGAVPEGARPGVPYVRLHARTEVPIEVVLPIGPER